MNYLECASQVKELLPEELVLDQLIEECGELIVACNKRKRALDGRNPTPTSQEDALREVKEESQDVLNVLVVLGLLGFDDPERGATDYMKRKMARWPARILKRREEKQNGQEVHRTPGEGAGAEDLPPADWAQGASNLGGV